MGLSENQASDDVGLLKNRPRQQLDVQKNTFAERRVAFASRFGRRAKNFPLVGALLECSWKNHYGALVEFMYAFVWATMPFWLGGLIQYAVSGDPEATILKSITSTFKNGELLVFVISAVAPTLYFALNKFEGAKALPHALSFSTLVMVVIVLCAVMFALLKVQPSSLNREFVFLLSVILTIAGLFLRYLSLVYHRQRMPMLTELEIRQPQFDFVNAFNERHASDGEIGDAMREGR